MNTAVFQVNVSHVQDNPKSLSAVDKELKALWVSQMVKINERWQNSYSQSHPLERAMKVHHGERMIIAASRPIS